MARKADSSADFAPYRYLYDTADGRHPLPGLWFTADERLALVTLKHLLTHLEPGLLDDHLRPLHTRIDQLLASRHLGAGEARQRIRLLAIAARCKNPRHFQIVAGAVLQRKRLAIDYYNRQRDETTRREISPQRLAHYRDNGYLDAWCHDKKGLRSFAVECIREVVPLTKPAKTVAESTLNRELGISLKQRLANTGQDDQHPIQQPGKQMPGNPVRRYALAPHHSAD